jgi:hypothetical protein
MKRPRTEHAVSGRSVISQKVQRQAENVRPNNPHVSSLATKERSEERCSVSDGTVSDTALRARPKHPSSSRMARSPVSDGMTPATRRLPVRRESTLSVQDRALALSGGDPARSGWLDVSPTIRCGVGRRNVSRRGGRLQLVANSDGIERGAVADIH